MEDTEDGRKRVKSFSLMTEVPENRTCKNAGILDSFCSCHQIKEMNMEANLTDIFKALEIGILGVLNLTESD